MFGFSELHRTSPAWWPSAVSSCGSSRVVATQLLSGASLSSTFFAVAVPPIMSPPRISSPSRPSATEIAESSRRRTCHAASSVLPLNSSLRFVGQFWITEIVNVRVWTASSLRARSVERYSTVYSPGSERLNGPVYSVQSPPPTRYSVFSTPLPPVSVADSVTVTGLVPSGSAGSVVAVVTGGSSSGSASTSTVTSLLSVPPSA